MATHGNLGAGLIEAIRLIAGGNPNIKSLSLEWDEPCESFGARIENAHRELGMPEELVIFTDLLGGTPCNQGTRYGRLNKCYTITGVNLPMLVEYMTAGEEEPIREVVNRCTEAGRSGIMITSRMEGDD